MMLNGRRWKQKLIELWNSGNYSAAGISPVIAQRLQQARNTNGPRLLRNINRAMLSKYGEGRTS
jgi:hypothetical protein